MNPSKSLPVCLPLVRDKIKHQDYDHVVALSEKTYRPLITGEKADHLIHRFNRRETAEDHKQRMLLTQLITPAICNTLMTPLRKVGKVRPVVNTATYGEQATKQNDLLADATTNFWAGKSVDDFIASVLLDQGELDPNAFCLVLFDDFDARYERPKVYPSLVTSADAWNFAYTNGDLYWLMVHRTIKYEVREPGRATKAEKQAGVVPAAKVALKDGHAWWWYDDTHQIVFRQVDGAKVSSAAIGALITADGSVVTDVDGVTLKAEGKYYFRVSKTELYEVAFYEHKAGMVQAFRLGFVPDHRTSSRTMVSFVSPAVPYMLKGVKAGSELDISAALHAFLQKLQYANPCGGYRNEKGQHIDCDGGYEPGGNKKCRNCGGSGYDVHTTGQDHVTLRMPRTKEDFLDLAQMVHYVPLPVEVLQWQDGYVDKLERKCYGAVYNSDRFNLNTTNQTATGDIIDLQSVYDALKPAADWFSRSHVTLTKLAASFVVGSESLKNLTVAHAFPRNLRFETLGERVALLKAMREAGASSASMVQVDEDIQDDLYIDDRAAAKKAKVQASFDPFRGKQEATIVSMISQDLTTLENKVFWTNMAQVFTRCEELAAAKKDEKGAPVDFYWMTRAEQQKLIDQVVDELVADIEGQREEAAPKVMPEPDGEEPEEDGEEEDDMPDSPGNSATA